MDTSIAAVPDSSELGGGEMTDDVGPKEKFVADKHTFVSENWLPRSVFHGPNFNVEALFHER